MSADLDHSRSSRRPRPEVAVYRPGSGPLKKSTNNAENIQSSSTNKITSKGESKNDLVSSLRNVTISDERKNDRSKLPGSPAREEPKSKRYSSQKQERNARKAKISTTPQLDSNENKSENGNSSSATRESKRPNQLPEKLRSEDSGSNQDLRHFLIEKRLQKNKESPSSIHVDGKFGDSAHNIKSDLELPLEQAVLKVEQVVVGNGLCADSHPEKSWPGSSNETSGLGRNNERRGSRRRHERKSHQIENSPSEGQLSSLTSTRVENSTNQQAKVADERKVNRVGNASNKVTDRRDRSGEHPEFRETFEQGSPKSLDSEIPPKGPRRRKRNNRHGGSRRGSVSSDRVTPVPDLAWADYPTTYDRADDERSERSLPPRPNSQQSFHRNRQSPSPHRGNSRNRKQQDALHRSQAGSPSRFAPPSLPATSPQRSRQHAEYSPPQQNAPQVYYYQRANYSATSNRDNRSVERHHAPASHDGRPPTGRSMRSDRHALPSNFDSLPPRLKKKYEEERLIAMNERLSQPSTDQTHPPNDEWDGGSLTFMNASGSRLSHSQSFPAPSSPPRSSGSRPYGQGVLNKSSKGVRAIIGPGKATPRHYHEQEDRDMPVSRPRSQDSMGGGMSDHGRERKTSFTDSRSSTPSSSLECTASHQPYLRGNLRRLDEVSATQTSLDWGEEMEEEDRRSLAEDPKYLQQQAKNKEHIVQFASADVRYQNKPIQGYTVIPSSNGMERITSVSSQPTPLGRPVLGQGRLQESRSDTTSPRMPIPGLIQLPHGSQAEPSRHSPRRSDTHPGGTSGPYHPRGPPRQLEARLNDPSSSYRKPNTQRTLFDPSNPHKPIVVASREEGMASHIPQTSSLLPCPEAMYQSLPTDQSNSGKPAWYDPQSESFRASKSPPPLLMDIVRCDMELSWLLQGPGIIQRFGRIKMNREFIQRSLRAMLTNDLRFCQMENVEQHMWKIAFHNVIEALRKSMSEDPDNKEEHKTLLFTVIDDGTNYFEQLLDTLQEAHKFSLDKYLEPQPYPVLSGLGYVGLAVISCQKVLVFLGDLARYREMTAETSNYGKAKNWYTKANLANPKNGRPYNQLAILALYARRKLDAVYLYMRSLMASNPFQSARESLVSLFDENRKKYEQQERKRKEAKEANSRRRESSGVLSDAALVDRRGLRREIWIHPSDGHRTRRMTSASATSDAARAHNSDDEELAQLPSIEVNKRFVTSYLNVQGKLYTKIGMETFQECGVQMLREFRALLQQTPLPVKQDRLLQLLALNMFAVSNTQLKDARMAGGCRSAWQECALIVSLEMFNVLLERCNALLKEQLESGNQTANNRLLGEDLQIILPAIKVWCDWLLCHSLVWNPPPNSRDYHVGPPGTPWTRLATLINLLSKFDTRQVDISARPMEGYEAVKLPEDVALCGFTPLMLNIQEPHYAPKTCDEDMAADCVRIERVLYFGRDFLCGLDPPVLKLKLIAPSLSEYVSVVEAAAASNTNSASRAGQQGISSTDLPEDDNSDDEALLDQLEREEGIDVVVREGEEDAVIADKEATGTAAATAAAAAAVTVAVAPATDETASAAPESATDEARFRELRQRKDELTQRHREHERRKQQLRAILQERVQLELEVRPKYLVADTNCYIDHLADLVRLTRDKSYTLVAPLVVLNELEGLCRSRLANEARSALAFLREKNPHVRYVTSKGAPLPTFAAGTMTEESDDQGLTNDDRILQCCLSLIKPGASDEEGHGKDGVRKLHREVVLLTDDRNLRVKALSRDVPVRDLPAFVTWSSAAATASCPQ